MEEERVLERDKIFFKLKKEDGSNFTLHELVYVLDTTREALETYYREFKDIHDEKVFLELSPEIVNVGNGCIRWDGFFHDVVVNCLSTIIAAVGSKLISEVKNRFITLIYKCPHTGKKHSYKFTNGDDFSKIGASFFVSYLYCIFVDTKHDNWKRIKNPQPRVSRINKNRSNWKKWLKEIQKMQSKKLGTNTIGLSGDDIKTMGRELLKVI